MTSKVEICNMAIGHCRGASINSLSISDKSNEAAQCRLYYDIALKYLLENNFWKFTQVVDALAVLTETPREWLYSYARPSDLLTVREIVSDIFLASTNANNIIYRNEYYNLNFNNIRDFKVPYQQALNTDGSQAIWTNEPDAYVAYSKFQEDPTKYSAAFIMCLSHYLASLIAIPIAGRKEGRAIAEDNLQLYSGVLNQAMANNEIEQYEGPPKESEMITIRFNG